MSLVLEKADQFRQIIRILNTNVDGKQQMAYEIRSIKGIGRRFAIQICKVLRLNLTKRAGELTDEEAHKITEVIKMVPQYIRDLKNGKNYEVTTNELETKLREDLERIKKIKYSQWLCLRHHWGLRAEDNKQKQQEEEVKHWEWKERKSEIHFVLFLCTLKIRDTLFLMFNYQSILLFSCYEQIIDIKFKEQRI
ncbi:unnamed protein product (macronuclear) [Paramecium tetraurelia]|uniref:40S ribosomal protein S18 n=1 Tax=Paramecium tetraurelia TaxID=5888 RepID=A0EBZ1_PARTE|nr:uncharacterized protein GSPATT00025544001 [Paramecium tetraurelia]CAK92808.1 unnamed protein product [Paramecium tetraurelia]|eukprot:XP_001460205.1 hypothetical protein (macronuclear) [Paramecium tetraurelia strain d4-2]